MNRDLATFVCYSLIVLRSCIVYFLISLYIEVTVQESECRTRKSRLDLVIEDEMSFSFITGTSF